MVSDVISADTNTDQEEVARLAARYNLLAIPVVDASNCLVGIVTIDDVVDVNVNCPNQGFEPKTRVLSTLIFDPGGTGTSGN